MKKTVAKSHLSYCIRFHSEDVFPHQLNKSFGLVAVKQSSRFSWIVAVFAITPPSGSGYTSKQMKRFELCLAS